MSGQMELSMNRNAGGRKSSGPGRFVMKSLGTLSQSKRAERHRVDRGRSCPQSIRRSVCFNTNGFFFDTTLALTWEKEGGGELKEPSDEHSKG